MKPTVIDGQAIGTSIAVTDSTALAELSSQGLALGTVVFNIATGTNFVLTASTASLDPDNVVAVDGITGQRWIKQTINGSVNANPVTVLGNPASSGPAAPASSVPVFGTGGVSVAFGPTPIPADAWMRYRGDDVAGADGDAIAGVPDASGNGNDMIQTDPTKRPVLKTGVNGINGHAVIQTTNNGKTNRLLNSYLSILTNIDPTDWPGLSVYYVARIRNEPDNDTYSSIFGMAPNFWFQAGCGTDPNQGAGWAGAGGAVNLGAVTGLGTGNVIYGSYRFTAGTGWKLDGVNENVVADTTVVPTQSMTMYLGSNIYPSSQSDHDIAEVIVYRRTLSDQEDAAVKGYLKSQYGLAPPQPNTQLSIGFPDTLTLSSQFCYVNPAGSDSYDGLTPQTAKQTVLAAFDTGAGYIEVNDGSYIGGEVAGQGLWLSTNPSFYNLPGWRQDRVCNIVGVGGETDSAGFTLPKARLFQGRPGDLQTFDINKPLLWVVDSTATKIIENFRPGASYGVARLQVTPDGHRDGEGVDNIHFTNVTMSAPPDTGTTCPAWDCGYVSLCWWNWCEASGSSTYIQFPALTGDNVVASTRTWTLTGRTFTSDDIGGWLEPRTSTNGGAYVITAVFSAHSVQTDHVTGDETFVNGSTIFMGPGPAALNADDHAGWLFRPQITGSSLGLGGIVYLNNCSTLQSGIKYYCSGTGIALFVNQLLSENGPQPHLIQIDVIPGSALPALSGQCEIIIDTVGTSDAFQPDPYDVWINPLLWTAQLNPGDVSLKGVARAVYGPGLFYGDDAFDRVQSTTPLARRLYGTMRDGRLSGRIDAGRRLGSPGTALPTVAGGSAVTNLASHDPSTWTTNGPTLTPGTMDILGLTNACDIATDATDLKAITMVSNSATYADSDLIVCGFWMRSASGPLGGRSGTLQTTIGSLFTPNVGTPATSVNVNPFWDGNSEWQWCSTYAAYVTPGGSPVSSVITLTGPAQSLSATRFCYPVFLHLRAADGWTAEEAAELAAHMQTWNPHLAQGSVGTLRGQPFVADGGLGINSSVTKTVGVGSGQLTLGSVLEYEPRYSGDGRTVIGWVPIYSATVNP